MGPGAIRNADVSGTSSLAAFSDLCLFGSSVLSAALGWVGFFGRAACYSHCGNAQSFCGSMADFGAWTDFPIDPPYRAVALDSPKFFHIGRTSAFCVAGFEPY